MLEPECGSCQAESCQASFALPGKCPQLPLHSSCRELYYQTLLSALRASPKPASWSSLCMLRTFPSLTTKLLLPEWPRSTAAPALSHTAASPLYTHSQAAPSQPSPPAGISALSPVPPAFTSGCSYLTSSLPCTAQARASIMLSCFLGECRCFTLAL